MLALRSLKPTPRSAKLAMQNVETCLWASDMCRNGSSCVPLCPLGVSRTWWQLQQNASTPAHPLPWQHGSSGGSRRLHLTYVLSIRIVLVEGEPDVQWLKRTH
jgi:hypothetical protein